MPGNAEIGKWIRTLFVSWERAAAVVGHVVERGRLSWFTVFRVALAAAIMDLRDVPFRMAFLAVRAFILGAGAVCFAIRFHSEMGVDAGEAYYYAVLFAVGVWMASRAPGREMATCLAWVGLQSRVSIVEFVPFPMGAITVRRMRLPYA